MSLVLFPAKVTPEISGQEVLALTTVDTVVLLNKKQTVTLEGFFDIWMSWCQYLGLMEWRGVKISSAVSRC
jgi:hypothetical protein